MNGTYLISRKMATLVLRFHFSVVQRLVTLDKKVQQAFFWKKNEYKSHLKLSSNKFQVEYYKKAAF